MALTLYHGTSTNHLKSIKKDGLKKDTWLAWHRWHAFQLADRTSARDGGFAVVLEIAKKVLGRKKPSYKYDGGDYIVSSIYKIIPCVKIWEEI
jgi:RNA:NAD 2'-phosphotransferase (TPT1/KptA family)